MLSIVNRSSVPVTITGTEARLCGGSLGLAGVTGLISDYGCESSNKQLDSCKEWKPGKATMIFGWGTRMAEIECHVTSNACDVKVGGPNGSLQEVQEKKGFRCVWDHREIGGLWNVWVMTVLDHESDGACGAGVAEVRTCTFASQAADQFIAVAR